MFSTDPLFMDLEPVSDRRERKYGTFLLSGVFSLALNEQSSFHIDRHKVSLRCVFVGVYLGSMID
jgi:hypothetical protein